MDEVKNTKRMGWLTYATGAGICIILALGCYVLNTELAKRKAIAYVKSVGGACEERPFRPTDYFWTYFPSWVLGFVSRVGPCGLHVTLASSTITDEGLEQLASLGRVVHVDLRDTDISNHGLKHLGELRHLNSLSIRETRVSDAGVAELGKLASLTAMEISEGQLSASGIEELEEANPDLVIVLHSSVTIFEVVTPNPTPSHASP